MLIDMDEVFRSMTPEAEITLENEKYQLLPFTDRTLALFRDMAESKEGETEPQLWDRQITGLRTLFKNAFPPFLTLYENTADREAVLQKATSLARAIGILASDALDADKQLERGRLIIERQIAEQREKPRR